jgi:hypothetical protein
MFTKIKAAAERHGISADLLYETDLKKALDKGIMSLPALEVDGVLRKVSHNPKEKELCQLFSSASK